MTCRFVDIQLNLGYVQIKPKSHVSTSIDHEFAMRFSGTSKDRLASAWRQYGHCNLCEHRCGANRLIGERGPCKAGPQARVFKHRVEYGEERELVPSYLIYLSGCDLRCAFCIAEENAFDAGRGVILSGEFLSKSVAAAIEEGARTIQWVGGEPTIHLPAILEAMSQCPNLLPIVWKSDFYGTEEAFDLLEGVVDVYLADFKFGNNHCARRIAGVDRYFDVLTRNLLIASQQVDLIVRHLLLPGHFDCCFVPLVNWMHANLSRAKFSLRDCYLPRWRASRIPELALPLAKGASVPAREFAVEAGLNLIV